MACIFFGDLNFDVHQMQSQVNTRAKDSVCSLCSYTQLSTRTQTCTPEARGSPAQHDPYDVILPLESTTIFSDLYFPLSCIHQRMNEAKSTK